MPRSILSLLAAAALALVAPPAFAQTAPAAPTCTQGQAGLAPTATLTFTAPTTNTDGTPIAGPVTYNILEGTSPTDLAMVSKGVSGSPVTINAGLADGTTAYFAVVTVDAHGNLSALSNIACKTFPAGTPSTVTITIT